MKVSTRLQNRLEDQRFRLPGPARRSDAEKPPLSDVPLRRLVFRMAFWAMCMLGAAGLSAQTNIQITEVSVDDNTPNELQTVTFTIKMRNNGPQATTA